MAKNLDAGRGASQGSLALVCVTAGVSGVRRAPVTRQMVLVSLPAEIFDVGSYAGAKRKSAIYAAQQATGLKLADISAAAGQPSR